MLNARRILPFLLLTLVAARPAAADPGILLLAHGGAEEWNQRVIDLAAVVDETRPTEVAFGMASRATIQAAVDRLAARGVTEIVAVPLFVSSWSSVITSTEFLLGLRDDAPPALAMFATMDHGGGHDAGRGAAAGAAVDHGTSAAPGAAASGGDHAAHMAAAEATNGEEVARAGMALGTTPVDLPVPVRMTSALNDHPVVADILASRARTISRDAAAEALVIVAHGPTGEDDNRRWLADMESLAGRLRQLEPFASIEYLTVRDDAAKDVRDAATAELRAVVERLSSVGRRVLIVPLLISFGGIERGLRERLEGLDYTMAESGLMPDDRLATWVLEAASTPR